MSLPEKIVNVQKVNELNRNHVDGKVSIAKKNKKWIHLELWYREFID